jgi:ASC-1-like (ASCH) protein
MINLYIKNPKTFSKIEASLKTVEIRLNRGFIKNLNLKINDKIYFQYQQEKCLVKLTNIQYYKSIEECFKDNKLEAIYGGTISIENLYDYYKSIYKKSLVKFEIMALHFIII